MKLNTFRFLRCAREPSLEGYVVSEADRLMLGECERCVGSVARLWLQFQRAYGSLTVSYEPLPLPGDKTLLRANACVANQKDLGAKHLLIALGDEIMCGRQLRVLTKHAERQRIGRLREIPIGTKEAICAK